MALVVNERDVLLQSASSRLVGVELPPNVSVPALVGVSIQATSQIFSIPETGSPYPSAITLRVVVGGLTATPTLSIVSGTMSVTPTLDSDYKFTFSESDMTSDIVVFEAQLVEPDPFGGPSTTYTDQYTVLKAREGAGAVIGFLTNENFTVVADSSGNVTSYTGASGRFMVIRGIEDITEDCTFAVVNNPNTLTVAIDPSTTGAGTYNVSGGFSASDDTATVTFRATYGTLEIEKVFSLSKAKRGSTGSSGSPGSPGAQSGYVYLYAWSTSQPANPNGSSTYTWATAAHTSFTGTTWSTSIGSNPGTAGVKLWVAQQAITDSTGVATSTTVTWASSGTGYSVYAAGQNGNNGLDGLKYGIPTVYRWAASIPAGPSGSDTYTWSSGSFSGPSGIGSTWFFNPPTSPSAGFTLWGATVNISDTAAATTTNFNWTSASVTARGYAGNNGGTGSQGASARYGYARIGSNPSATGGNLSVAGDNLPSSTQSGTAWGSAFAVTWSTSDPNPASTNTLYQIDGIYDPATGLTTWAAPYISSLKVGTLSAVAVNTGSLNVNADITVASGGSIFGGNFTSSAWPASGGGFYLGPTLLRLGRLASGQYFEVTSAGALTMPGLSISGGSATFSGTLSAVTGSFGNVTMSGFLFTPGKTIYNTGNGVMIGYDGTNSYLGVTKQSGSTITGMWVTSSDGVVHMSGADVSGGTITGSVLQTASSGTRVVINESSSGDLRFYEGSTLTVRAGIDPTYNSYVTGGTTSTSRIGGYFLSTGTALAAYSTAGYGMVSTGAGSGLAGVYSTATGGAHGVYGYVPSGAGYGVFAFSVAGGLYAEGQNGIAIEAKGVINTTAGVNVKSGATTVGQLYYSSGGSGVVLEAVGSRAVYISTNGSTRASFPATGGLQVNGGFGCNGASPQGPAASGGTLAGVIAALVANGILSS